MEAHMELNSPLTQEQLDYIFDVDFDSTQEITFHTKNGKEVHFVKKQPKNGWISVNDRMPSEEEVERTKFGFLCYIKGFFIMPDGFAILSYNKEAKAFWSFYNNRAIDNVTHWMLLPNPPEEGKVG